MKSSIPVENLFAEKKKNEHNCKTFRGVLILSTVTLRNLKTTVYGKLSNIILKLLSAAFKEKKKSA